MSHLYRSFNMAYIEFFRKLYESYPQEVKLFEEVTSIVEKVKADKATPCLYLEWSQSVLAFENALFNKDETIINEIDVFQRTNMSQLYTQRFMEEEKQWFWDKVLSLYRYRSMLAACGNQIGTMEEVALDFVKRNQGLKPEQFHQKVFEEMLSGGDMTKRILETFQQPGSITSIIKNFSSLMRVPGQDPVDLSAIEKLVEQEDPSTIQSEFVKFQESIRESGVNPFDEIKTAMATAQTESSQLDSSSVESCIGTAGKMSDMMRQLAEKMAKDHQKELDNSDKKE
jgi:hypothetical protein